MARYETLILVVPEITADESTTLEQQFDSLIKKTNGSVLSFERWGKYKLAYPVRKNDYGIYFLGRFETTPQEDLNKVVKDIDNLLSVKYGGLVMRHLTSVLNPKQSLTYLKPDSLEDIPSQDVDTFLRDNKIKNYLNNSSAPQSRSETNLEIDLEDELDNDNDESDS